MRRLYTIEKNRCRVRTGGKVYRRSHVEVAVGVRERVAANVGDIFRLQISRT